MTDITDEYMQEMLGKTRMYTLVLLKSGPNYGAPDVGTTIWEHGRRNFVLRAKGVMPIVGPLVDDTEMCGVCIMDAPVDEVVRLMDDDPGVQAGIFTYEVHPMRGFPGSALP
jgi:hypothetical protein